MKKMKNKYKHEFTVNRKTWVHGTEDSYERLPKSGLLIDDGRMCCLGHLARSCGVKPDDIRGKAMPDDIYIYDDTIKNASLKKFQELTTTVKDRNDMSRTVEKLAHINDYDGLPLDKRQKMLTSLFKRIGIKVQFK